MTNPFPLNNPVLGKMLQQRAIEQQQPQAPAAPGPSPTPAAMNAAPQPLQVQHTHELAGMDQPDPELQQFYRTHPGRHPMDEKPDGIGGLARPPVASQKSLAKVQPIQPNPAELGHQQEYNRLTGVGPDPNQGKSGISQIKNPVGRTLLHIADAIGGGLFPNIAQYIPGTQLHHGMLVGEERGALKQEQGARKEANTQQEQAAQANREQEQADIGIPAQAEHDLASAENLRHPVAKPERITNEFQKWMLDNPQGTLDDWEAFKAAHVPAAKPTAISTPFEKWNKDNPDATVADWFKLQAENRPATGDDFSQFYQKYLKEKNLPDNATNSKRARAEWSASGQPPQRPPESQMLVPDGNGGYVSRLLTPGAHVSGDALTSSGLNTLNTPTSVQRDAAGRAVTMTDLDTRIRKALQNPEIAKGTGPLSGRLSEIQNRLGTLPHDLAELKNDLVSYGAFQAGLHPVRGIGALQYFDKVMGGLGQDRDELLGKLDSNLATAQSVKRVGGVKEPAAQDVKTQAEFDALPSGAVYMENGKRFRKP